MLPKAGNGEGKGKGGSNGGGKGPKPPKPELKPEPTFFIPKIKPNDEGQIVKKVSQKNPFKISFETDAPLDYFKRNNNMGNCEISIDGKSVIDKFQTNMGHGNFMISFTLDYTTRLGKREIRIKIYSTDLSFCTEEVIILEVVKEKPRNNDKDKQGDSKLGLPKYKEINHEDGIYDDVNSNTAAFFEEDIVLINMKNDSLVNKLNNLNDDTQIKYAKTYFIYAMIFSCIAAKGTYARMNNGENDTNDLVISEEDYIKRETEAIARTLFINENLYLALRKGTAEI